MPFVRLNIRFDWINYLNNPYTYFALKNYLKSKTLGVKEQSDTGRIHLEGPFNAIECREEAQLIFAESTRCPIPGEFQWDRTTSTTF